MIRCILFAALLLLIANTSNAANGYQTTANWWNTVIRNANQYSLLLQNLYANVETQTGSDKSKLSQEFSKQLSRKYPGSTYYGSAGTLALNSYTFLSFDSNWKIIIVRQTFGSLQKSYNFHYQTADIANGPNRVSFKLDPRDPSRATFVQADIPAITVTARQIWETKGAKLASSQPLCDILNDVYAYRIAGHDGTGMEELAVGMTSDENIRRYVLDSAIALYASGSSRGPVQQLAVPKKEIKPQPVPLPAPTSIFGHIPWYTWLAMFVPLSIAALLNGTLRKRRPRHQRSRDDFQLDGRPRAAQPKNATTEVDSKATAPTAWSRQILSSLEWKRFETVCCEYLRLIGFDPKETRIGADGGVDIWVYKAGNERPVGIVQCKAWKAYKVGVKPVRELFGVMAAEDVAQGMFITSGEFTGEAIAFCEGKSLKLISGEKLLAAIQKLSEEQQRELLNLAVAGDYRTPTCPQCGIKMTLRNNQERGKEFWGCQHYPRCRATLSYKDEDT